MNSALYRGHVVHRRHRPTEHRFRYRLFLVLLDLDELDTVFARRWLWSTRRFSLAWFRRRDHLGDPAVPLQEAVRRTVAKKTGHAPAGPIRILTHLRYFGYVQNPVSFYFCYDAAGAEVEAIVAEINNTPWGERHCYVLSRDDNQGTDAHHRYTFAKAFHVSPFMPMELGYEWRFGFEEDRLEIRMANLEGTDRLFDAALSLTRKPITGPSLAGALVRHPFMTAKVVLGIYWNALRLWMKRVRFHAHPKHGTPRTKIRTDS